MHSNSKSLIYWPYSLGSCRYSKQSDLETYSTRIHNLSKKIEGSMKAEKILRELSELASRGLLEIIQRQKVSRYKYSKSVAIFTRTSSLSRRERGNLRTVKIGY